MSYVDEPARIYDPAETMPRDELEKVQLERLRIALARMANVPFYQEAFAQKGLMIEDVQSLDDLRSLPMTTKEDLRKHYPLGFLAVPRSEIARLHGSSGTTGKPTFVAFTKSDLELWSRLCARFLVAGGLRSDHLVQIAFGYGLFTGGFGLHYGVERVGAAVLLAAAGNTPRQIMMMQDLKAEVLVCTPSYALNIAEQLQAMNITPTDLPLKYAHLGGEPWTEDMRQAIEEQLAVSAFNNYGLSEVLGPGVSGECIYRNGMHVSEDHFLVECVDPETLEPVEDGQPGELVITSFSKVAMPILRYRTRDIAILDHSPCPCGRTGLRMSRVLGRSDDMLIIRGVNVFPSQIEEALLKVEGAAPHYQIEVNRLAILDEVTVHVEVLPDWFSDKMSQMQELRDAIIREIQTIAQVRVEVNLVEPKTLERFTGKAKRVVDNRNLTGK
jgi:phenylacetate-CoA ligase